MRQYRQPHGFCRGRRCRRLFRRPVLRAAERVPAVPCQRRRKGASDRHQQFPQHGRRAGGQHGALAGSRRARPGTRPHPPLVGCRLARPGLLHLSLRRRASNRCACLDAGKPGARAHAAFQTRTAEIARLGDAHRGVHPARSDRQRSGQGGRCSHGQLSIRDPAQPVGRDRHPQSDTGPQRHGIQCRHRDACRDHRSRPAASKPAHAGS